MIKRFVGLFLSITMFLSLSSFTTASISQDIEIKNQVISQTLKELMDRSSNSELIDVYIWLSDIDHNTVKKKTFEETGFSETILTSRSNTLYAQYKQKTNRGINEPNTNKKTYLDNVTALSKYIIASEKEQDLLAKDIDTYIMKKRQLSSMDYISNSNAFINKYIKNANILFISKYAPMIVCSLTKSEIKELSQNTNVKSISCKNNLVLDNTIRSEVQNKSYYTDNKDEKQLGLSISVPYIYADLTKNLGFRGTNIKIGQIEGAHPNENVSGLSGKNIIKRSHNIGIPQDAIDHATLVSLIMIGDDGVAPNATLYTAAAYYLDETGNNYYESCTELVEYENIEWLLDQGVTVINRSFGSHVLDHIDVFGDWIEHVVSQHNVAFVQALGNKETIDGYYYEQVSTLALNAIVVGAVDNNNTVVTSDDTLWEDNCDIPANSNKPDVVAPGANFTFPEKTSDFGTDGTSCAAPHVTGIIAQMLSGVRSMIFRPDAIKAAIISSCDRKIIPGNEIGTFSQYEGAGIVNALLAINNLSNITANNYYTTNLNEITYTYYPEYDGVKVIAASWLYESIASNNSHTGTTYLTPTTHFQISIYDSDGGQPIATSLVTLNNIAMVSVNVINTEHYIIKLTKSNTDTNTHRISLAVPW